MEVLLAALPKDILTLTYIDDTIFFRSEVRLWSHVSNMIKCFTEAGFHKNYEKLEFLPSRLTKFLRMIIGSVEIKVYLPSEKCQKLRSKITELISMICCNIKMLAELIGYLHSCTRTVAYSPWYLKKLQIDKSNLLEQAQGQFDKTCTFSSYF